MQPYKITLYIYADNEVEVQEFERTFHDFVSHKREQGIAVTAKKMTEAIRRFANHFLLAQFFK